MRSHRTEMFYLKVLTCAFRSNRYKDLRKSGMWFGLETETYIRNVEVQEHQPPLQYRHIAVITQLLLTLVASHQQRVSIFLSEVQQSSWVELHLRCCFTPTLNVLEITSTADTNQADIWLLHLVHSCPCRSCGRRRGTQVPTWSVSEEKWDIGINKSRRIELGKANRYPGSGCLWIHYGGWLDSVEKYVNI